MNDERDDAGKMSRAAVFLDAATNDIDARTQAALTQARVQAAESAIRHRHRVMWGGAGLGFALAASLAVLVVLPQGGAVKTADASIADVLAEQDIVLAGDAESAIADDMAFVAWLEENPDA